MSIRAVVEEREYEVVARLEGDGDEETPRSDKLAAAYRLGWEARMKTPHPVDVVDGDVPSVVVRIGDAPDAEFDEVAGILLEAAPR